MSFLRRLRHTSEGATAVEYGLIAALLALGIVGSLVTTKTSLQSVFGSAGSGLERGGSSHPAVAVSPSAANWTSQTLLSSSSSNVSSTGGTYTFNYPNNQTVVYTVRWNPDGSFAGDTIEYKSNLGGYYPSDTTVYNNALGQPTSVTRYEYQNYSNTITWVDTASASNGWSGNAVLLSQYGNQYCTSGQCYNPSGSVAGWGNDALYFRGVVSQM